MIFVYIAVSYCSIDFIESSNNLQYLANREKKYVCITRDEGINILKILIELMGDFQSFFSFV